MFIVNMGGTESGITDLTESAQIPVLQDTGEASIIQCFGASKWYVYVVDKEGVARFIHYQINLETEVDRLLSEVGLLNGEAK